MTTNTFSNVSIPVGTQTFGPVPIPDGLTGINIRFTTWPQAARTLAVQFEVSINGGAFQQFFNMNPWPGNTPVSSRTGNSDSTAFVGPLPAGINRQAQAVTTVVGGTVVTTITITST